MEGVTTAIVAFLFVCMVFPNIVKNKTHYYVAYVIIAVVILLTGLARLIDSASLSALTYFSVCCLQVAALVLLILACRGLSLKQLMGEVEDALKATRDETSAAFRKPAGTPPPPPVESEKPGTQPPQ